jgi:hypothetical protein
MLRFVSFLVLFALASTLQAQGTVVVPSALNGVEGSGFYIYNGPITFQQVTGPSQLGGLQSGSIITGMQLRLDSAFNTSPASNNTNFDVYLGPSNFAPGSLTNNVANNQGAGTVQVRSGSLNFAANAFPVNGSPNDWGPLIPFTNTFTYTGGNLLMTVAHTAPSDELNFDIGGGLSDVQIFQAQVYNATTLTDSEVGSGLAVRFVFTAVPEPAVWYALGIVGMVCGTVVMRRRLMHRFQEQKLA